MDRRDGNQAMDVLASHLSRLNTGMKELQELNIDTTLSSLPKYAVVGDQSAGKSSIVQALCGIALPRSSGTTTRCPFLITTHKDPSATGSWRCKVSIKKQDYHDVKLEEQCDTNKPHITHFTTITDPKELEDTLRRAQLAILNPQDDPKDYVDIELVEDPPKTALFSKNIICLDVQAPNLPELMFYDLPGCINVYDMPKSSNGDTAKHQDEERKLIEMITSTVTSYIQDEQCLLLLACSADQDVEMSLTMKYIRQHSAESRCIGVFTKADLVTPTRLKNVQDILKGHKYQLGRGWFVTKQLSQQEIDAGVDFGSAKDRERDMFATASWAGTPSLHDRYGMPNLQDEIAGSLASHIVSELPNMAQRIELRIAEVNTELDQFPDPPREPNHVVMKLIEQFVYCLSSHINADSDDNPFRMQYDSDLSTFSKQLQTSKLVVSMDKSQEAKHQETVAKQGRSKNRTPTQPRKRSGEATSRKRVKSSPYAPSSDSSKALGLDELQMRYDRGATNSISGSINDKVTEQLIRESCAEWKDIVSKLLKSFSGLVRGMISGSVEEALSQWNRTKLYGSMQQTTLAYFNQMMVTEGHDINKHLDRMYAYPTTYNKDFEATRRSLLKSLMEQRYPTESANHNRAMSSSANASLIPLKKLYKEAKDGDSQWTNERLAEDKFGSMINCVATIHTFQDILSSNFADTISMHLKSDVLAKLRDETATMLRTELKVLDTPHCAQLLAEDPAREKQRKQLLAEKAELEKAVAIIEHLQDTE